MKKITGLLSFIFILSFIYYSFYSLMPQKGTLATIAETEFSTQRALLQLKEITKKPHYYGSQAHGEVQNYLVTQLKKLGAETQIQDGYVTKASVATVNTNDTITSYPNGYHLVKPQNIIGRIKGSNSTKSLVLLSHYDSAMVPSYGASDAGSGVVTILESVRAFLATGKQLQNDIIILFTDAEELGLDGATLFVNEHPWAKDVGLVLNFEARGSGGPSNMILETNQGNANLIKEFITANPEYPVASSLMYSIYKMLPNDTDSTVFREDGDIDSFFFAFIDDHFDYHTANDTYENLDEETLQHQGSYLLPLLHHFATSDLSKLKADEDYVYVNAPFIKMINYPFSWIPWMLLIAIIGFIALLLYGISKRKLKRKTIARGFVAFLTPLLISGLVGFLGWKLLLWLYPHYNEIQHGFTYNGHTYIAFFVLLTLAIVLKTYKKFGKNDALAGLYVAPLLFWFMINIAVFIIIKGAAYFIIPVFFGLFSFWLLIKQEKPNLLLLTLLASPAAFLFSPLIQFFPVGLGLKMLVVSCVFTVLTFGLILPVVGRYLWKNIMSAICFISALVFFIVAHFQSDFSENRQKPNSLIYYQNAETQESYWVTYDKVLDDWTKGYLGETPEKASKYISNSAGSKYNTSYSYAAKAPKKQLNSYQVRLNKDTLIDDKRSVSFTITPQRNLQRLAVYADKEITFNDFTLNGTTNAPDVKAKNLQQERFTNSLVRYYIANNEPLTIEYTVDANQESITFTVLECSYDLLEHSQFSINKRAKNMMPKPFVITDAIIVKKSFSIDSLQQKVTDSLLISETIELNTP